MSPVGDITTTPITTITIEPLTAQKKRVRLIFRKSPRQTCLEIIDKEIVYHV